MTKPTQGVMFNMFQDQLIDFTDEKYPYPGKPKNIVNIK